jgi:molybdenum transport protein
MAPASSAGRIVGDDFPASALSDLQLDQLLREDLPYNDLTTDGLGIAHAPGMLEFTARSAMRCCGLEEAARLFQMRRCRCGFVLPRGSDVQAGRLLLRIQGTAASLHAAWKTAQTLVEATSGIATATAAIVRAVDGVGKQPAVVATRKNFPGTRVLSALAVRAGGGGAHRLGLSETLLVFPEHRVFLDPTQLAAELQSLRRRHPEKKLVIEVLDGDEAVAMARMGADVLQLEKFTPEALGATVQRLAQLQLPSLVAAAGGVNAANAADYARAGADIIVTSAPYWAPPSDVQVRFQAGAAA